MTAPNIIRIMPDTPIRAATVAPSVDALCDALAHAIHSPDLAAVVRAIQAIYHAPAEDHWDAAGALRKQAEGIVDDFMLEEWE